MTNGLVIPLAAFHLESELLPRHGCAPRRPRSPWRQRPSGCQCSPGHHCSPSGPDQTSPAALLQRSNARFPACRPRTTRYCLLPVSNTAYIKISRQRDRDMTKIPTGCQRLNFIETKAPNGKPLGGLSPKTKQYNVTAPPECKPSPQFPPFLRQPFFLLTPSCLFLILVDGFGLVDRFLQRDTPSPPPWRTLARISFLLPLNPTNAPWAFTCLCAHGA